jgi:hypothetical protein
MLNYAPIDKEFSSVLDPPSGLGLYVGKVSDLWAPPHVKPSSSEYIKRMYAYTHSPSFERIGNNTVTRNECIN